MMLSEIDFLSTMLIMLLMTLAVVNHLFILVCLLYGVAWLAVRHVNKSSFLSPYSNSLFYYSVT